MLIKTFGSAVYGVEAITITVEVSVNNQGKDYYIVGLPDSAVKESLQRVESAVKSNHYFMPRTKLVVNLAPADIRKTGTAFDLPIAIGTLGATAQIENPERLIEYVIMGELSLDGEIRPIKGALPIAIQAKKDQFKGLMVPIQNAKEAAKDIPENITQREKEILQHMVSGWDAKRIASELNISTLTVRKHIANIYEKLHVSSRAQIIMLATKHKWL